MVAGIPQPRLGWGGMGKAPSAASWGTGRWQGWLPDQFTVPARGTLSGPQQAVGFGSFSSPSTVQIFKN